MCAPSHVRMIPRIHKTRIARLERVLEAWGIMAVGERRGQGRSYRHLIRLQYARRDEEQDHVPLNDSAGKGALCFTRLFCSQAFNASESEARRTRKNCNICAFERRTKRTSGSAT